VIQSDNLLRFTAMFQSDGMVLSSIKISFCLVVTIGSNGSFIEYVTVEITDSFRSCGALSSLDSLLHHVTI